MNRYWSKQLDRLDPYTPGEQPQDQQYIKLNTNENPYPPSLAVSNVIRDFEIAQLRRYPDPESAELIAALASYHNLDNRQVFVGNGSDEVLAHAFQAFFRQDDPILFPDISYSFYPVYCKLYEIDYRLPALGEDFCINLLDYASTNGGIIIPNPNAPTGIALSIGAIRELLADNPESVVIIDEAYVDYGAETACQLIAEFPNLLVVQTFSKSRSLAGLRLGCAFAQEPLIEALQRVKNSFNSYPINSLTSAIALASIADEDYFQQCRRQVIESREALSTDLRQLGFEVFPSSSNFVFTRHPDRNAEMLYRELKAAGILVRYFKKKRIDNCLRITIGTETECEALVSALQSIL
ncbi:MAG: histidinol-phosphate transaminase [Gammaproteobacteria bacterium]|nr:histidinol-phosphate transaminase [Gammaproteobacteria bacterium]